MGEKDGKRALRGPFHLERVEDPTHVPGKCSQEVLSGSSEAQGKAKSEREGGKR